MCLSMYAPLYVSVFACPRVSVCIHFRCFVLASGISGCLCGSACASVRIFISVYEPFVLSSSVVCVSVGGGVTLWNLCVSLPVVFVCTGARVLIFSCLPGVFF